MARKQRIHFRGACYHVILRGNAGQAVFIDDADRCRYFLLLQEATARFACRIHAFCCMSNHIHIAIQVDAFPLSRIMQNISLRYTTWINKKYRQSGHIFQGRYKAILIDANTYLLELVRYIHLNPVRAGMVSEPTDYPWSGHRSYIGNEALPWLTTEWVLSQFSAEILRARKGYYEFVLAGMSESRRGEFHSGTLEGRTLPAIAEKPFRDLFAKIKQPKCSEKVVFYAGCLIDFAYPEMAESLIKVLNKGGIEVIFPEKQTCCGAPARYNGAYEVAAGNAIDNIKALLIDNVKYVVSACPTCTLVLKHEFISTFESLGQSVWMPQAKELSAKTVDFSTTVAMDCPGCVMQMRGGFDQNGADVKVLHTVELLVEQLK